MENQPPAQLNRPAPALLTLEQAAALLHVSQSSVRSYIRQGVLPAFRIAGLRELRITRAAALALLQPARPELEAAK